MKSVVTVSLAVGLALATTNAAAQTFSLPPGSPTIPPPAPGLCGPGFAPDGDIYLGPAPPTMVAPMGPPGCGLGYPAAGNVDAFSSGVLPLVIPPPPGSKFFFSVGPAATGDPTPPGPCFAPATPGPTPPDVGSEAGAQPGATDASTDVFVTAPSPALPAILPGSMANAQIFDGDGLPAPPFGIPPAAPLGLVEPFPGGDGLDAFDGSALAAWDFVPPGGDGIPDKYVYYSVDGPTAVAGGFLPGDVLTTVGGAPAAVYAPAPALGLDLGGPGTDDLNALVVFDADGFPAVFTPAAGDVVLFSVGAGSLIVGTPDPCPASPLFGTAIELGDILTEGTPFGAPGAACVLVPSENMNLWSFRLCGANPVTGGGGDNLDAVDAIPTLSEWGIILMSLVMLAGVVLLRRRRRAAPGRPESARVF